MRARPRLRNPPARTGNASGARCRPRLAATWRRAVRRRRSRRSWPRHRPRAAAATRNAKSRFMLDATPPMPNARDRPKSGSRTMPAKTSTPSRTNSCTRIPGKLPHPCCIDAVGQLLPGRPSVHRRRCRHHEADAPTCAGSHPTRPSTPPDNRSPRAAEPAPRSQPDARAATGRPCAARIRFASYSLIVAPRCAFERLRRAASAGRDRRRRHRVAAEPIDRSRAPAARRR